VPSLPRNRGFHPFDFGPTAHEIAGSATDPPPFMPRASPPRRMFRPTMFLDIPVSGAYTEVHPRRNPPRRCSRARAALPSGSPQAVRSRSLKIGSTPAPTCRPSRRSFAPHASRAVMARGRWCVRPRAASGFGRRRALRRAHPACAPREGAHQRTGNPGATREPTSTVRKCRTDAHPNAAAGVGDGPLDRQSEVVQRRQRLRLH
jgi:hypothetical protein